MIFLEYVNGRYNKTENRFIKIAKTSVMGDYGVYPLYPNYNLTATIINIDSIGEGLTFSTVVKVKNVFISYKIWHDIEVLNTETLKSLVGFFEDSVERFKQEVDIKTIMKHTK
jgi:hypothetical protein